MGYGPVGTAQNPVAIFTGRKESTHLHVLHPVFTWYPPALGLFIVTSDIAERHTENLGLVSRVSSPRLLDSLRE